jgi:hypothetical protein
LRKVAPCGARCAIVGEYSLPWNHSRMQKMLRECEPAPQETYDEQYWEIMRGSMESRVRGFYQVFCKRSRLLSSSVCFNPPWFTAVRWK